MSSTDFYRAFEERYRGSRDVIKERLKVYQPTLDAIKKCDHEAKALDLGCGRGEWLELLNEQNFNAFGVDLDEGMLEACQKRGLRAEKKDAIEYLEKLDDESLNIITGFHIAEHLPFETLQKLIKYSLRALKPGGILILETPNPENIVVAGNLFYLDPSHLRPIPPQLLSFSAEHSGFMRVKVLRLQEDEGIKTLSEPTLWDVLERSSPDYALLAQKEGPNEIIQSFDHVFDKELGLKPQDIAKRFDQSFERKISGLSKRFDQLKEQTEIEVRLDERARHINDIEKKAEQQENRAIEMEVRLASSLASGHEKEIRAIKAEARANEQEARAQAAETRASEQEARAQAAETRASEQEARAQALEGQLHQIHQTLTLTNTQLETITQQAHDWHDQILNLHRSLSWRITSPIRFVRKGIVALLRWIKSLLKFLVLIAAIILSLPILPLLLISIPSVLARPALRNRLGQRIKHYPKLRYGLRLLAYKVGLIRHAPRREQHNVQTPSPGLHQEISQSQQIQVDAHNLDHLTPRARLIYYQLVDACKK